MSIWDTTTGTFSRKGVHEWDKAHRLYNDAVRGEMAAWLKNLGKSPSQVTPAEAKWFLNYLQSGPCNKSIRGVNEKLLRHVSARAAAIAARMAARHGFKALGKEELKKLGKKLAAPRFFISDWWGSGSVGHAAHQAAWPVSEMLVGPSDYDRRQIENEVDADSYLDMSDIQPDAPQQGVTYYPPSFVGPLPFGADRWRWGPIMVVVRNAGGGR